MHRPGVVGQQQAAFAQFVNELLDCGLTDTVHAMVAQSCANFLANRGVFLCPEKNPFNVALHSDRRCGLGKAFRQPSFRWPIFGARAKAYQKLRVES